MTKMTRQRLLGLALIVICVLIVFVASEGSTPEERDVTAAALLFPLGVYAMLTKKYILTDADAEHTEEQEHGDLGGTKWQN